jgi:hypothetical protein
MHSFMFDKKDNGSDQSLFPSCDFIPEFTIVNLQVMTSNNDTEPGYGIKLQKISLHYTSLYSCLGADSLYLLPETFQSASDLAVERAVNNPFIQRQMEGKNVAFYARAPAKAFISSVPVTEGYYRMVGPNGSELFPGVPCVDIAKADLVKHANVVEEGEDGVLQAITLLDFASCANALGVYVVGVQSNFSKSKDPALGDFRGIPLVDVDAFLKSVDFGESGAMQEDLVIKEDRVVFPFKSDIAGLGGQQALVTVFMRPVVDVPGKVAPCPDFSLLSEEVSVGKGYLTTIGTKELPDIVRVVFNVMGCLSSASGTPVRLDYAKRLEKKRKLEEAVAGGGGSDEEESGAASP